MQQPVILYERVLPEGPSVRIRVTTPPGALPLTVVLEIERRVSQVPKVPRGAPPRLAEATANSADEALAALLPLAENDGAISRMLRDGG